MIRNQLNHINNWLHLFTILFLLLLFSHLFILLHFLFIKSHDFFHCQCYNWLLFGSKHLRGQYLQLIFVFLDLGLLLLLNYLGLLLDLLNNLILFMTNLGRWILGWLGGVWLLGGILILIILSPILPALNAFESECFLLFVFLAFFLLQSAVYL